MQKLEVLLFSGGMDSLIASHFHPRALKLYVATGSKYEGKERSYLRSEYKAGEICYDERLRLGDLERADSIVPARNLFLTAIAALYGDRILLCAVDGDGSTDKDSRFAFLQTALLRHVFSPPHFHNYQPEVVLPLRSKCKGSWVRDYLMTGGDPERLARSVSCYHPMLFHCGRCKACIRKWVAQEYNGITTTAWNENPADYNWEQFIPAIKARKWRCTAEDAQTEHVLRMHGVII